MEAADGQEGPGSSNGSALTNQLPTIPLILLPLGESSKRSLPWGRSQLKRLCSENQPENMLNSISNISARLFEAMRTYLLSLHGFHSKTKILKKILSMFCRIKKTNHTINCS